jgi:DHA1 family bicyclomycin/chloramphenicol resistance-like MFS transporter
MRAERAASPILLVVLSLIATSGPLLSDLYLPGLPQITAEFQASASEVQLTLTASLIGVALGQLILGPASDRFGRRWVLIGGLILGILAGFTASISPDLVTLIVARLFQGFGIAAGLVISRAIVSDVTIGSATVRWLGVITIVAGLGSLTAPMLGGVLNTVWDWRAPLWALSLYLLVVLVLVVVNVPDTRGTHAHDEQTHTRLWSVPFIGASLTLAFGFGGYIAFLSASPFIYQEIIGWSSLEFGFVFSAQALVGVAATLIASRLSHRIDLRRMIWFAVALFVITAISVLVIAITGAPVILLPFVLVLVNIGNGVLLPSAMALALSQAKRAAGLASAVLGCLQFALAAIVAPLVSLGSDPLATFGVVLSVMSACAVLSFTVVATAHRRSARAETQDVTALGGQKHD